MNHPPNVPTEARFFANDGEWRLEGLGSGPGPARAAPAAVAPPRVPPGGVRIEAWWPDGVPRTVVASAGLGRAQALFRLHPDGHLFRTGLLVDGLPHGTHRAYGTDGDSPEVLQVCCVPPGAWQLVQSYRRGQGEGQAWYDRQGLRLLGNGAPFPRRPPEVPREAEYNELSGVWEAGVSLYSAHPTGTRTCWDTSGALRSVEELVNGQHRGRTRIHDPAGQLLRDVHYEADILHGPWAEWILDAEPHFALGGVRQSEGQFDHGQAVGVWRYCDADGREVARRDLGLATPRAALTRGGGAQVLTDGPPPGSSWLELGHALHAQGRVVEAVLAVARAAAAEERAGTLVAALHAWTMPLASGPAAALARDITKIAGEDMALLLDGIRRGADAPSLLWMFARGLSHTDRAALELVNAALLLRSDPEGILPSASDGRASGRAGRPSDPGSGAAAVSPASLEMTVTRALMLGALGEPEAALREAEAIALVAPEQGDFLRMYLRVYFPRFDFWPAEHGLAGGADDPALAPAHSLDEINAVIQRLATRLSIMRQRLVELVPGDAPFLWPSLDALLPDGPVPLRSWSYTLTAAEYSGEDHPVRRDRSGTAEVEDGAGDDGGAGGTLDDEVDIAVDERLGLPGPDGGVLALMRRARADWSALTWLCWAVGLDHPALATAIRPPPGFARAAVMTMERTWRCQDKRSSSGLLALTRGIPGFDWAGTPIDLVPAVLVDVATDEYLEARAVFTWLCDPFNRSLWQIDLREG
jgi:hypothetical protein